MQVNGSRAWSRQLIYANVVVVGRLPRFSHSGAKFPLLECGWDLCVIGYHSHDYATVYIQKGLCRCNSDS